VGVDVVTEIVIDRPVDTVSAYTADPTNAPSWYARISSVELETEAPLRVGSRMAFVARFLGRRLAYSYEIVDLVPGERLGTASGHSGDVRRSWRRSAPSWGPCSPGRSIPG
jgi:uncharacterized membrane protein